ncbi:MAG: hypothetical protein ACK4SZ_13660 [Allosphingosinicella sp.]|uniref:hypothetical protein n=1 Tax=Allosphingosinicella sp. TaxID=2823234 RepID=UPI00395E4E07
MSEMATPAGTDPAAPEAGAAPLLYFVGARHTKRASKYRVRAELGTLHVDLEKPKGAVDARVGQTGPAAILSFSNRRLGLLSAIALDLDGNGLALKRPGRSRAAFDMDGDGIADKTGWVGRRDGLMVVDRDGDGRISSTTELSFLGDRAGAASSLHGLGALDSNRDGVIDAADQRFGELKVWIDRNGNGVSEAGELAGLADIGIKSIDLGARATNTNVRMGNNVLLATATFTRDDGSSSTLGDVAFAFRPSAETPPAGGRKADRAILDETEQSAHPADPAVGATRLTADANAVPVSGPEAVAAERAERLSRGEPPVERGALPSMPDAAGTPAAEADYLVTIERASARLIQAMGAFGFAPVMMVSDGTTASPAGAPELMTLLKAPSVDGFLSLK